MAVWPRGRGNFAVSVVNLDFLVLSFAKIIYGLVSVVLFIAL